MAANNNKKMYSRGIFNEYWYSSQCLPDGYNLNVANEVNSLRKFSSLQALWNPNGHITADAVNHNSRLDNIDSRHMLG